MTNYLIIVIIILLIVQVYFLFRILRNQRQNAINNIKMFNALNK
jgi:preprotein translocase subunit YajC